MPGSDEPPLDPIAKALADLAQQVASLLVRLESDHHYHHNRCPADPSRGREVAADRAADGHRDGASEEDA